MNQNNDLRKKFCQQAEAVSAVVTAVADLGEAFEQAARMTASQGGKCLAAPGWDAEDLAALGAACEQEGLELITQGLRERAGEFYTGLTKAQWGVAETGTILVESSSEELRLASMLSEAHVAVLPAANLRADLFALEDKVNSILADAPGYLAFISGPSRTGDIELVLTLGAHGPRQLHILLVEDES